MNKRQRIKIAKQSQELDKLADKIKALSKEIPVKDLPGAEISDGLNLFWIMRKGKVIYRVYRCKGSKAYSSTGVLVDLDKLGAFAFMPLPVIKRWDEVTQSLQDIG